MRRKAFTLVELLVVIGIIAVLIGVLLPALSKARKQAQLTVCMSNQKQLVAALLMYCGDNKGAFPGGPGHYKDNGILKYTPRLAAWDTESRNPYSCNQDEENGPVWLAKYVGNSKKIPGCPSEPDVKDKGLGATNLRTNYWYPLSLVYTPWEIWNPAARISDITTKQTCMKITQVRHPTQKCIIIERNTYHDKVMWQVDRIPPGQGPGYKNNRIVVAGFADSHVERRLVSEMLDATGDVNYTGREVGPDDGRESGVYGRDFK
jgi:prepilin-type N-terminal cleavage/methylation domain-containing protein